MNQGREIKQNKQTNTKNATGGRLGQGQGGEEVK